LFVGHIAALAGVGETTVRNALREAKQLCLVAIEIRRVTAWRNDANVVTITSAEWSAWLARSSRGGGCISVKGTVPKSNPGRDRRLDRRSSSSVAVRGEEALREAGRGLAQLEPGYPLRSPETSLQGVGRHGRCLTPDRGGRPPRAS
jgi:hypothetical protein